MSSWTVYLLLKFYTYYSCFEIIGEDESDVAQTLIYDFLNIYGNFDILDEMS